PAHPRSFPARDLDAPSGAGGGPADRGSGERANRVAVDARPRPGGTPVSSGTAGRRVGVLVSGRGELAGASAERPAAGADAGGLRGTPRRHATTAGLSAPLR